MKKTLSIILLLICLITTSCSKNEVPQNDGNKSGTPQESLTVNDNAKTQEKPTADGKVDVDLTVMSSTMVYAEVYNIMLNPDDYIGKTIKMSGPYSVFYHDQTGKYYHYVIIEDATSCCQQGLEFIWNGKHTYPDDYPPEQIKIEVAGVFGRYEELGQTYHYLAVDNISIR